MEVDRLAVISMAGLAAEGLEYDKVVGQSADLFTLQEQMEGVPGCARSCSQLGSSISGLGCDLYRDLLVLFLVDAPIAGDIGRNMRTLHFRGASIATGCCLWLAAVSPCTGVFPLTLVRSSPVRQHGGCVV